MEEVLSMEEGTLISQSLAKHSSDMKGSREGPYVQIAHVDRSIHATQSDAGLRTITVAVVYIDRPV